MDEFIVSVEFPVSAKQLYLAWLSSQEHSAFTGSEALIDPQVSGSYSAWDGYIQGKTLELDPHQRIVQSWRTVEFADSAPDSKIELSFTETAAGVKLTLRHTGLQSGDGEKYEQGWEESYFSPMRAYYSQENS